MPQPLPWGVEPVTDHPLSEKRFSNMYSEFLLTQVNSISLCPTIGLQREEINTTSTSGDVHLEEVVGCDEVTPQPFLLQDE